MKKKYLEGKFFTLRIPTQNHAIYQLSNSHPGIFICNLQVTDTIPNRSHFKVTHQLVILDLFVFHRKDKFDF